MGHSASEGDSCGSRPLWQRLLGVADTGQWVKALAEELRAEIASATQASVRPVHGGRGQLGRLPQEMRGRGEGEANVSRAKDVNLSGAQPWGEQRKEGAQAPQNGSARGGLGDASQLVPRTSQREYEAAVRECQRHIRVGESYELCLTTQLEGGAGAQRVAASEGQLPCARPQDALDFYLTLRSVSPAPYGAWLSGQYRRPWHASPTPGQEHRGAQGDGAAREASAGPGIPVGAQEGGEGEGEGEESVVLCCSSPERFLRLDASRVLEAKPIKGTRPRGATPEEDRALAEALRTE